MLDGNDASLALWRDALPTISSPGYALLKGRNCKFGEAARQRARLQPQQINHRFWSTLDIRPMRPKFGSSRHSADLVHAHLLAIHAQAAQPPEPTQQSEQPEQPEQPEQSEQPEQPQQWIIGVPGNLQHDQLALLLGIIEQCPFTAVGLVDRAVAALSCQRTAAHNWHIELQLHQALLTCVKRTAGQLRRDQVIPIPGAGWLALQDSLAQAIATAFIRQTRFDPRRQGVTEQDLYDQLPALLVALQQAAEYNMELGGHRARIERDALATACAAHYTRIARVLEEPAALVHLGPTLAQLPAIDDYFPAACTVAPESFYRGVAQHAALLGRVDNKLHFITRLPAGEAAASGSAGSAALSAPPAARPIAATAQHCRIDMHNGILTLHHHAGAPPRLNGAAVTDSQPLAADDTIALDDGKVWRLVELSRADGNANGNTNDNANDNGAQT